MSDKEYKHNKDFEDQGWENMSSILNKEMPVKKKKRKFFLLFFLVGIASCGGAIWMGYENLNLSTPITETMESNVLLDRTETKVLPSILEPKESVDHVVKEIVNDTQRKIESQEIAKSTIKEVAALKHKNQTSTLNQNMQSYNQNFSNQVLNNKFPFGNTKQNQAAIIEIIQGNEIIEIPLNTKSNLKENTFENAQEAKEIKPEVKALTPILELEPIAFLEIENLECEKEFSPFKINTKLKKHWKFGIESGLTFQNKNEMGTKLGFVSTVETNGEWAFHTGLEYQVQFVRYSESEQEEVLNSDLELIDNMTGTQSSSDYNYLPLSATRMNSHFIKIPIIAGYRFHPSFEITAGLIGSTLIYTRGEKASILDDFAAISVPTPELTFTKKIDPRFDVQSSIGLSYYPSKKWALNLRYDNGFLRRKLSAKSEEISTIDFVGYNSRYRQLSLSARMYF